MSQTPDNTLRIPSPSDAALIQLLERLSEFDGGRQFRLDAVGVGFGEFSSQAEVEAKFSNIDWKTSRLVRRAFISLRQAGQIEIFFHRHITKFGAQQVITPSPWEAEIYAYPAQNNVPDAARFASVWAILSTLEAPLGSVPSAQPEVTQLAMAQFSRLTELHTSIVHDAEAARLKAEAAFAERMEVLEAKNLELRATAEAQLREEQTHLEEERAELAKRQKELDDRDHMHVRRQLRADITAALKGRLREPIVSRSASQLRLMILIIGAIGLAATIGYAAFAAVDFHNLLNGRAPSTTVFVIAAVRFALPAAAAAGLFFYVLGWLKQIHSEDVRTERDLERYRYDVDRASWSIETIMEAQAREGAQVPSEWIDGVTRGLFDRSAFKPDDDNPLEALASLLNIAARAELGPAGPKIEIERRGLRRLGRSALPE